MVLSNFVMPSSDCTAQKRNQLLSCNSTEKRVPLAEMAASLTLRLFLSHGSAVTIWKNDKDKEISMQRGRYVDVHWYHRFYKFIVLLAGIHFCSSPKNGIHSIHSSEHPFVLRKWTIPWRLCASSHRAPPQCFRWYWFYFLPKYCVRKDSVRYVLSKPKPFELLSKAFAYR